MAQVKKRKEAWIMIQKPDGTNMIASPGYIRSLLGIPEDLEGRLGDKANWKAEQSLRSRINMLENALEPLLKDYLRKKCSKALPQFKPDGKSFRLFDLTVYLEKTLHLDEMVYRGILYDLFEEELAASRIINRSRGWFSFVPAKEKMIEQQKQSEGKTEVKQS
jgi:hypothetical protein